MKYFFCLFTWVLTVTFLRSQSVSINNDGSAAHESAMLDIKSNNKGLLMPRMNSSARTGIVSPATGLIVYDTTLNGYYCYNGTAWINLSTELNTWKINGNAGTNPGIHFIGTSDNQPLTLRVNNIKAGLIDANNRNVLLGTRAAFNLAASSSYNTILGDSASYAITGIATGNTVIGFRANAISPSSFYNTAIGIEAGKNNTGHWTTFIGESTGMNNQALGNVFIGSKAGRANTTGYGTFVGDNAGRENTTGIENSYFGYFAGQLSNGSYNSFLGSGAGANNTTGGYNTGVGAHALIQNVTGSENTASGAKALYANTSGSFNTAIGMNAMLTNTGGYSNTATGSYALYFNSTGIINTATGHRSMDNNTTGSENVANGYHALGNNTTGSYNTAIGTQALNNNTTADSNTATGYKSLYNNLTGSRNTAFGNFSLYSNTTGTQNLAVGINALLSNTTGVWNTAIGVDALFYGNGIDNTAVGSASMEHTTIGSYNVGVGSKTLHVTGSGYGNTAVGFHALIASTGNGNVAVGYLAGDSHTGHNTTLIGNQADAGAAGLDNATAIGFASRIDIGNAMSFGSDFTTRWCFGRASNSLGALQVGTNPTNGNGAHLTVGGTWTNASDENLKENLTGLDSREILEKISLLKLTRWTYKGTPKKESHIGPMAQQFRQLFDVGTDGDDKSISTIDPSGIALVAIQELRKQNLELQKIIEVQNQKIDKQQQQLDLLLKSVKSQTKIY